MNPPHPGTPPEPDRWTEVVSNAENFVRGETDAPPAAPPPLPGRRPLLALVGLVVATAVGLTSPSLFRGPPAALSPTQQASDLRAEVAIFVEHIEAYRQERGELPPPSALGPFLDEGYTYRILDREGGRYEVRRAAGGVEVVYDGSLPLGLWISVGGTAAGGGPS